MSLDPNFILTFGMLAAAVASLWMPAAEVRGHRSWLWCITLALACGAGVSTGYLGWPAPAWLAVYAVLALSAREASRPWLRIPLLFLTGAGALLLSMHRFPGFFNPALAENVRFSEGATPFTIHANFDTTAAGIVLMGVFCDPQRIWGQWSGVLRRVWPITISTLVAVLGTAVLSGYVKPDLKWTAYSAFFLGANLLFTCVTEEAFFRGFMLARIAEGLSSWRYGTGAALVISAMLFGIAHAKGGPVLIVLATIAGLHYGAAYLATKRVEGAILTHFALNAVHFVAFTYPNLSG
jgi:membrane protease YdiL (CAAX protease family)